MELKRAVFLCVLSIFFTSGFAFIFKSKKKNIPWVTLAGLLTCVVYVISCRFFENEFYQNLFPSIFAAAFAEVLARITKSTATAYSACSIVVILPGEKLFYTMYYIIVGDIENFHTAGGALLRISCGIAVGIVLVTVIVREVNRRRFYITNDISKG